MQDTILNTRSEKTTLLICLMVGAVLLSEGFWQLAHAARTDNTMLLGSIFLLIKGGGTWSADLSLSPGNNSKE